MKRVLVLLLCVYLAAGMAVGAAATETQTESCTHSWNEGSVVPPTCTQPGELTSVCTLCNEVKTTSINALGHSFDSVKKGDASNHIAVCGTCGAEETRSHNWSDSGVTKEATCTEDGVRTYTCGCGETKKEAVSALGHNFGDWIKTEKTHSNICRRCEYVESGSHSMKEEVVKEATCKESGSIDKVCTVCSYRVNQVVPKLSDHVYDNACDPECNSCGETRTVKHDYGNSWSRDHKNHWHECIKCGEKTDLKVHYPGPAATEDEPQVCLTCDYVITERLEHKHEAAKTWTTDEYGHWHECKNCDEQLDYKKHSFDNQCDETCNVCDYVNEAAHDVKDGWQTTDKKHWMECSICGKKLGLGDHVPGPEATEKQAQLCTVCDYELTPMVEHTHVFGDIWMYDGEIHWKECQCGEKSVPMAHDWGNPTKGKGGSKYYTCTECLAHKTEAGSGFPWWILIVLLFLLIGGGIAVYFLYITPGATQGSFLDELSAKLFRVGSEEDEPFEDTEFDLEEPVPEQIPAHQAVTDDMDIDSILKEFAD